jgi:hypothetical protein
LPLEETEELASGSALEATADLWLRRRASGLRLGATPTWLTTSAWERPVSSTILPQL